MPFECCVQGKAAGAAAGLAQQRAQVADARVIAKRAADKESRDLDLDVALRDPCLVQNYQVCILRHNKRGLLCIVQYCTGALCRPAAYLNLHTECSSIKQLVGC